MVRLVKNKFTILIALSILLTGVKLVYADDLSQYYYYDKVAEPSSILTYIHDDNGHMYETESGMKPTWKEAQDWWSSLLKDRPELRVILTEKQKHTGMSYEAICLLMCKDCNTTVNTKDTYESIDKKENEAYKSAIQTLLLNNYRVLDSNGDSIQLDINKWYSDYDKGLYDKRDNMKHYIHDPDRSHTYRTKSGVKPEYEEAMEWWRNHIESTPGIDQHFTEQQLAGKGMYEYITELMCIDCTPTKAEKEMLLSGQCAPDMYSEQKAERAGIGEIYPEENGKAVAELREQANKLGYTLHKESTKWIDQEDLSKQMRLVVLGSIVAAISLSASILIITYMIRNRKKS